jgi:HK97 gp10 family phage protein
MIDQKLQREIDRTVRKLNSIPKHFDWDKRRNIVRKGAEAIQKSCRAFVRDSKKVHYRYKGGEKIPINPGNLRRSIRVIQFRGTPDLFVGPVVGKRGGKNADGFYAHMVENGTVEFPAKPFMRPGFDAARPIANKIIRNEFNAEFGKLAVPLRSAGIDVVV